MKSGLGQLESAKFSVRGDPTHLHFVRVSILMVILQWWFDWKSMKSGLGQLEPQSWHLLMIIWLKINEIWAWPAGAPKLSFFNCNLFENHWNLCLAIWSPKMVFSLIRIRLKINEIWARPAGAPNLASFNNNLIENQWNPGLVSWSPEMVIL